MNRKKFLLNVVLAVSVATSAIAGCGQGQNTTGDTAASPGESPKETLTMATSADYPPYEFRNTATGDEIIGFDVDIAQYIANELGFELEIADQDFNGLIPALQAGRADFVMAGMTPTEERQKNVDFSEIYYEAKNTIVAKKGSNLTTQEALNGKKIGVQLGSIQEKAAKEIAGVEVVPLNKIGEIVQEIKSNRIEAAIIEDTVAKGYTEANPDLEFTTIPNAEAAGSAIAFPKGSERVEEFNRVLQEMKDSGELEKLVKKWFEEQTPAQGS